MAQRNSVTQCSTPERTQLRLVLPLQLPWPTGSIGEEVEVHSEELLQHLTLRLGNSDAGAMQTEFLWNMIGLFLLTGQTTFLIHSPWFSLNISIGDEVNLKNMTAGGNSNTQHYVQSFKVNGKVWNRGRWKMCLGRVRVSGVRTGSCRRAQLRS